MTTQTENEQTAQNSAPEPLAGYALAFEGTPIKKSCETCIHFEHYQEYSYHELHCHHDERLERLKGFPFPNGCKHFDLHWTYTIDWDAEAKRMDAEKEICDHLSHGRCFKSVGGCENSEPEEGEYPKCKKAPESTPLYIYD